MNLTNSFILTVKHLELSSLPKDLRHEVNRGFREGLDFRVIMEAEHNAWLRVYRKRKCLLMPPWAAGNPAREFYGVFTRDGLYCCSLALFELRGGSLGIQGVSIARDCPYYAFSFLVFKCLELSIKEGKGGLDLCGDGEWKRKWLPESSENALLDGKPSLTGGRASKLLAKAYWFIEGLNST